MEEQKTPSLQERITGIIAALNINVRAFSVNMGQPYTKIYDIIRGRTLTLSNDVRRSIRDTYHVSEAYLLTGKGEMFETATTPDLDAMTEAFKQVVIKLNEENASLKKTIEILKKELEEKNKE